MSRWLTDELHVLLSPTRVDVAQMTRSLGMRAVKRQLVARETLTCDPDDQAFGWEKSLQILDAVLSRYSEHRPAVTLVLSNHFVRYVLVPWSDLISSDEQQRAYTRHCFQMTYGDSAANWETRLSRAKVGASQLASGIDKELLEACNDVVQRHGLRLASIQPYLMRAFNQLKSEMLETDAWFALVEEGSICLARFQQGNWIHFRAARLAGGWDEFARFLSREAFMGDVELQSQQQSLYAYAPHLGSFQEISGWKLHELAHPFPASLT